MKIKRLITAGILAFTFLIFLSSGKKDSSIKISTSHETDTIPVIIKGSSIEMIKGRKGYDLAGRKINTEHFAVRVTTPDNPFKPHKHEQSELWFIVKGNAKVKLDGIEYEVEENDLIILDPWVEHGLSTTSQVTWICLG
jgi:mannose-6-phosphate isomerase-like protein (cupin superfamily)